MKCHLVQYQWHERNSSDPHGRSQDNVHTRAGILIPNAPNPILVMRHQGDTVFLELTPQRMHESLWLDLAIDCLTRDYMKIGEIDLSVSSVRNAAFTAQHNQRIKATKNFFAEKFAELAKQLG